MATVSGPTWDSGTCVEGDQRTRSLKYNVFIDESTEDEEDVILAVAAVAPATKAGLKRGDISPEPLGGGIWVVEVSYTEPEDEDGSKFTFDTGGGTVHIAQSLETVNTYEAPGETAPDFKGAIGVNGDSISGTDITIPVFNFTETHKIPSELVTTAYKFALFYATGKVNNDWFKGFAAGEVLFLGASGSQQNPDEWEITFKFAASPNVGDAGSAGSGEEPLVIGEIEVEEKEGWDYLWIRFDDAEDNVAKTLVKRPVAAYVERVYQKTDFAALGIGT
jgi:hypothetical protein